MDTTVYKQFLTGSIYLGTYNSPLRELNGYGTYTYPDGSQYEGYFKRGLFNGNGQLTLNKPYAMRFVGNFEEGKLKTIESIMFEDGLFYGVTQDPKTGTLTTDKWKYLSKTDRRYLRDFYTSITSDVITAAQEARPLRPGFFDTEEGFYRPETGFITCIDKPYSTSRFVGCAEADWIQKNCRYGGKIFQKCPISKCGVPVHPECLNILHNNQMSMQQLANLDDELYQDACQCNYDGGFFEDLLRESSSSHRGECFLTSSELCRESGSSLAASLDKNLIEISLDLEAVDETDANRHSWTRKSAQVKANLIEAKKLDELQILQESYRQKY